MEEEAFVATIEHVVHKFFVQFCAECTSSERLCFATCKHSRAVRTGQIVGPASDGANVGGFAAIESQSLIEDATAHSVALNFVEIALHHHCFFFAFFFRNGFHEIVESLLESFVTPLLVGASGFSHSVAFGIHFLAHALMQFFVVGFVAVFAFHHLELFGEFLLSHTHRLDSLVCSLQCCNEVVFAHFVHFAFNHHNIVISCTYHQFNVCIFLLFKGWVDDEFTVDTRHAHFSDRFFEGHIAHCDSCRCCQAGKSIGLVLPVA